MMVLITWHLKLRDTFIHFNNKKRFKSNNEKKLLKINEFVEKKCTSVHSSVRSYVSLRYTGYKGLMIIMSFCLYLLHTVIGN